MCGQFQFSQELDCPAMRRLSVLAEQTQVQLPDGDIAPGCLAPVLVAGPGRAQLKMMQWGFPLGGTGRPVINARAETAASKPSFSRALDHGRCAIPTTGFYEWGPGAEGKKRKYRFNLPGERALYLAGLWNEFAGERKCVILTTAANASMEGIHDRMPVILRREEAGPWAKEITSATEILHRVPPLLEHREE